MHTIKYDILIKVNIFNCVLLQKEHMGFFNSVSWRSAFTEPFSAGGGQLTSGGEEEKQDSCPGRIWESILVQYIILHQAAFVAGEFHQMT